MEPGTSSVYFFMAESLEVSEVFVTFSDKPLKASEPTIALAGNTDDAMDLKQLLLLMYQTWMDTAFQEGVHADQSRILVPG